MLFCGSSTLSLPDWMMEVHKPLTFESVGKIYWCDQSDETSLATTSHEAMFSASLRKQTTFRAATNDEK